MKRKRTLIQEKEAFDTHLRELAGSPGLVVVEGKKDKRSLMGLGVALDKIYCIAKPLHAVVDDIVSFSREQGVSSCILLTDLDGQGKKLYALLSAQLEREGISIDNGFREFLFSSTPVRTIEGLLSYYTTLSD